MTEPDPVRALAVHMHLVVARRGETLTGQVSTDNAPARQFTGWIGLNAVIDDLLVEQTVDGPRPYGDATA
ncbi:hypothetical protein NBH00_20915 [Paraconexibacter antarcticus]|uniref:Uncharacterized protein n=1 Tax=Paraconexibacter antarcticus TaxID=2949664 RepID=A0ABY5DRB6_9ACTN|nr:hypothetical protein [Paraconexibacter antarcticus]UTI63793.1 hypothetical protein NBH00_20915 [Paraconexibacter antarcticus]